MSASPFRSSPTPSTPAASASPAAAPPKAISTIALHGRPAHRRTGPLVPGVALTTTYHQSRVGVADGPTYSRVANPSVDELESLLGELESAPPAVAFGTGLGAETALLLALLRAGDHIVVGQAVYGGTTRLVREVLGPLGIHATFVDSTDAQAVQRALRERTAAVFIETPANPTLQLTDIHAVAQITRGAGVRLIVDNTFLTAVVQRPLDLGADVCIYSTTKLIEGHSTACGGAVVSRDEALLQRVRWVRKCTGGIQSPLGGWLTTRGLRTLPLRVREQSRHAQVIARWLADHPRVEAVHYPGLSAFPQRELADRQHAGGLHGSVISFEVKGGVEAGRTVLESARLCCLVEHVGSVETLLTHPATMTHADVPPAQRRAAGITDGLIRLSVGLEDPADVIADLDQAIAASANSADLTLPSVAPTPVIPGELALAASKGGAQWLAK